MIHCLADNIHSPFGNTTADNFAALRRGAPTPHTSPPARSARTVVRRVVA